MGIYTTSDTIAAIATPPAPAGVGVIRLSGDEAIAIGDRVFRAATAGKTLGLTQIQDYLQGRLTRQELHAAIALATRQYAKRQRTWLRREKWVIPIVATAQDTPRSLAEKIALLLG